MATRSVNVRRSSEADAAAARLWSGAVVHRSAADPDMRRHGGCASGVRILELTTPPRGPQDALRRVLSSGSHDPGLLLACARGRPALLLRFGTGDDGGTLVAAAKFGAGLVDVLVVQHGRWRSLLCKDTTCCPTQGNLLPESSAIESFSP